MLLCIRAIFVGWAHQILYEMKVDVDTPPM